MFSIRNNSKFLKFFIAPVLCGVSCSIYSQNNIEYKPNQIIRPGNGLTVEVIKCRGEEIIKECDAILYTTKRQQGVRRWLKASLIDRLQSSTYTTAGEKFKFLADSLKNSIQNVLPKVQFVQQKLKDSVGQPIVSGKIKFDTIIKKNPPLIVKLNEKPVAKAVITELTKEKAPIVLKNEENKVNPVQLPSQPSENIYTLEKCYKTALANNLTIKRAQNNVANFEIDRNTAQRQLLPSISYNLGHYFSFGKNIDPVTNTFSYESFSGGYTSLGLQLELFSGFKKLNSIRQSALMIDASKFDKQRAELELMTNITLTYARILSNNEEIGIRKNNISNTNKEIEIINEKIKVGRLTQYEYYTFDARRNTLQAELVELQNDSVAAMQNLKLLMNIPHQQSINVASIDTIAIGNIYNADFTFNSVDNKIMSSHPGIKQAEMFEAATRFGEKIARGNYLPALSIGGNLVSNYNNDQRYNNGQKIPLTAQLNENLGQNININLRIPLFSQMENANRVKKERINIDNAHLATEAAKLTVANNTVQLINDFNAAKMRYNATASAYEQNKLSVEMYNEKYRLGLVSSVELLAAQDILNTSTSKNIQARLQLFFRYHLIKLLTGEQTAN